MLTATPIQNRLWDLDSLVDLLTVARGHQKSLRDSMTMGSVRSHSSAAPYKSYSSASEV
jgi:hypothetical protein